MDVNRRRCGAAEERADSKHHAAAEEEREPADRWVGHERQQRDEAAVDQAEQSHHLGLGVVAARPAFLAGEIDGSSHLGEEPIQAVALFRGPVARREQGHELSPVLEDSITATEASVTTTALLKAVNLDLFELSLWRHWGKV